MSYGIWGLSNSKKRLLHSLVLSRDSPGASEVQDLYESLVDDEGPIKALLERSPENHHFRTALIANPDEMLPKLSNFLRSLKFNVLHKSPQPATRAIRIPAAFTKHFILVLADEPPGSFDINSSGYHDLILAVLEFYPTLAGHATVSLTSLRDLISRILEWPREVCIIEKTVSDTAGATLLTRLLENNSIVHQVFTEASLRQFGSRLAKLITSCIASHGPDIEDVVLVWENMEAIHKNIEEQILKIESSRWATTAGKAPIHLSEAEKDLLILARIAIPSNITTARHTIGCLLDRYRDQIHLMLSSFPCSTCKARLFGIIKVRPDDIHASERRQDFNDINAPLGVFPIYLSDAAMKDLKRARVDGNLSKILGTLQKIADGMWESETELSVSSDKSRTRSEPVLRAARWCPEGYILWERGIGRAEENSKEWTQIVKVIRVGSQTEMKAALSAARKAQRTYTKEYRRAAAISVQNPSRPGTLIPKTFVGKDTVGLEVNNAVVFGSSYPSKKLAPSDALILHKIFCTGKQYSLTKRVAEMILQGGHQAEVPFVVSPEEESIINYFDSSVCILGRSGTGKTTCLVFRLLASYIRDRLMNDNKEVRQIFLTRSPVLAGKIRQYVSRLIDSHCMKFAIEDDLAEASDFDDIVEEDEMDVTGLLDLDDKDWPMICTFDAFATMLERSLRFAQRNVFSSISEASGVDVSNRRVDFGKFKRSYWPSFPTSAKKGLSVDGVFSEIIGVIKANSSAPAYQPLSEIQYQELSHRVAPNFRPGPEREAVYALYKVYEKRKTSFCEWDDLDRTARLQKLIAQDEKLSSRLRSQITEVFVDEIQDQRLPEIELLLDLVNDIKSFAFAGDTAQCISRDSCFRFQDLKRVFFQKYHRLGIRNDLAKLDLFTLSKNYRTHNGILKLAAKVVDILTTAFPYAIDKFTPELGDFDGPAPIFFSGFSSEIFVPREGESTSVISEFGAEQVLIVRDEEAKEALLETMGDKVLILTILESKGMEFQDVFLFDFFSGSSCQTAFRALANSQIAGSRLDDTKYPELCIELKNLYVAITRSREMLYIVESNIDVVAPIQEMWGFGTDDPIIDVVFPGDPTLQAHLEEIKLGQSNPEEWTQKGNEFFNQRMYEQAMYCYRRAGKLKLADMCQASIEERSGRDIISDPNCREIARKHYLEAAQLFISCEKYDRALRCYESIKEYEMAGELCEKLSKLPDRGHENYKRRAADFFMEAKKQERAIPLYEQLGLHELAISAYRQLNKVEVLIDYLKRYRTDMDEKLYYRNSQIIALTIFSSKKTSNNVKRNAISLLSNQEQERLYKQFKFYEELKELLVSQGRLEEAMSLIYSEGNWEDLRDLFKQAESNPEFSREASITNGEKFAERVLFYELLTSLVSLVQQGNTGSLNKGVTAQNLLSYPTTSKLFQDTAKALNAALFEETHENKKEPHEIPPESLMLADLLILQLFYAEKEKVAVRIQSTGHLMEGAILRSAEFLLDLHRNRVLTNINILKLVFQVVQSEHPDEYNVIKSSLIYSGNNDGSQQITSDEFLERVVGVLRQWIIKAFTWYAYQREQEYTKASSKSICRYYVVRGSCKTQDCRFEHKRVIQSEEMLKPLQIAWQMSSLTSYCRYIDRNGAFGGTLPLDIIRIQGHRWWVNVFDSIMVVSEILQNPLSRLFLAKKKSTAISLLYDTSSRREGHMILGCLDDFEWRLKRQVRNMKNDRPDFWNLLDVWEKMATLKAPRSYATELWWSYLRDIQGRSAMHLLHNVEYFCLSNPLKAKNAIWSFGQEFRSSLKQLPGSNENLHLLLNMLDRVMAIIIYFSSFDDFVLKKSQIEFLQENWALRRNQGNDFNKVAADVLNKIVDVYNDMLEVIVHTERTAWYRDAMSRRIEGSATLAILNSRTPHTMAGRERFIEGFLNRARRPQFWVARRGFNNPQTMWSVPERIDKFPTWVIENLDVVQGQADPIVFSYLPWKTQGTSKFRGFPVATVPFQSTELTETPLQDEEQDGDKLVETDDSIDMMEQGNSLANEKSPIIIKASETIQKNWRICSSFIRDNRYIDQHPTHRRITQILTSLDLPPGLNNDMFRKCFRLVGFVLLESIMKIKSEIGAIRAKLGASRKDCSMEDVEKILGGHEIVRGYDEQVTEIENSIRQSSLASITNEKSPIGEILAMIRKTHRLQETVSLCTSDLNSWIQDADCTASA